MSPAKRFAHGLVVVAVGIAALLALAVGSVSLAIARFIPGEPALPSTWVGVPIAFVPAIIAAGWYAIARRVSWRWLGLAILPIGAALAYLAHDDSTPSALPDLGPRVGVDDPGFQRLMWFAEKSPWSRLRETGAPSKEPNLLRLPKEPANWAKYVAENQSDIEQAVKGNTLGQEWIAMLGERPPAGICPLDDLDHILAYRAIRNTTEPLLALAYSRALAGQRDEAVRMALPAIRAMHNLRRTSANLVHAMIATIVLKQCYAVIGETLHLGPLEAATSRDLVRTLEAAPPVRQVFRNAFLGEADFLRLAFARLRSGSYDFSLSVPASENRRLEHAIRFGGTLVFHPNRTERQMQSVHAQMCSVAETRNTEALDAWLPDWGDESQLRNPVGRLLAAMAIPAFAKPTKEFWKSEDMRRELLEKAQSYHDSSTASP